jgi:hypothetical protein
MLTESQTAEFCSAEFCCTDLDKEIVHLLDYARAKLPQPLEYFVEIHNST